MQALQDSLFLQALGFAVINSLWQTGLLWTIFSFAKRLWILSSETKYRLSFVAQLLAFIWFTETIGTYSNTAENFYTGFNNTSFQNINELIFSAVIRSRFLVPFLSIVYLLMLVIKLVQWMNEYGYVQHIYKNDLSKIPPEWRVFVQRLSGDFGIKNKVKIYLSGLVNSPLTIGYLKPVILIPLASINNLSTEQMEAIILHELSHIKRADYLFNFLQSLVELIFFFNPFIKLLGREINSERENTCDDRVLQFQYNPVQYTDALLKLATLRNNTALALQASGNENGELLSRVRRILNKKETGFQYHNHIISILLLAILFPYYIFSSGGKTSPLQQNIAEPLIITQPEIYSDNFSLKNTSRLKSPIEQIAYKSLKSLPATAFKIRDLNYVPKEKEKITPDTKTISDQKINTTISNDPVIESDQAPTSFASFNYTYDSLVEALTPYYHANMVTPEISAAQAYKQSLTDYIRAAIFSKQIEDSTLHISIKGDEINKSSYKKIITIETMDSTGETHVTTLSVIVYQ